MTVEIIKYGDINKGINDGTSAIILDSVIRVANQAKSLAPVDLGLLKNSIMWKVHGNNSSPGEAPSISVSPKKDEGFVGSAVVYSIYQEFGTRWMAPQPFLRPAIALEMKGQDNAEVIAKILREKMNGALKEGQKRVKF